MRREDVEREMMAQPVRSLQYMLRRLSKVYDFLPELATDGVFGERTLEAVMLFQRELHPPVTGVVDRETWNAIRDAWHDIEARLGAPRDLRAFPGEGSQVEPGDGKEFMILPQTMFQVLSRYLMGIAPDVADGLHGQVSSDNVRWLQRAAGLEETGIMDWITWGFLSRLYEVLIVKDLGDARQQFSGGWG